MKTVILLLAFATAVADEAQGQWLELRVPGRPGADSARCYELADPHRVMQYGQ